MISPPDAFPALPAAAARLDVARERVVRLLTDRYADDSLTVEQFEAELDRLHATSDVVALERMAHALAPRAAAPIAPDISPEPVTRGARAGAVRSYRGGAPRRSMVIMGDQRYAGACEVPEQWEFRAVMSSVALDLREAEFVDGYCALDLVAIMSNVEVLVPADALVATDASSVMSSVQGPRRRRDERLSGVPIRIGGLALMSNVEVRVAPPGLPADVPFAAAWLAAHPLGERD